MIKRLILLTPLVILLIGNNLFSQARIDNKNTFYDAESWILFEDYKEALAQYQKLVKYYPNNYNFKYRVGQCYINIPGEKEKAIGFLEDAVKNINPKYREGRFRETGAPYDAYYYLANAYRINNQLDKALETYRLFLKNLDPKVYDSTIVRKQIESCLNAKKLMNTPLYVREKNLGNTINQGNSNFDPVISDDEKTMVFTRSEAFYDAIMYSTKTNGQWNSPLNMNEILKVDRDLFPTSISSDGKTIFLYSSADYDGVILTTTLKNNVWSPPVKLNDNINTKYWESHATISHDSRKLYFTSNRKGTLGGLDIYVSKRDSTGDWGPAANLGPVINSPYNEDTPFLSDDDKTLFFSSRGHFNMGGYDIFYSTMLDNGQWSVPLNVGYPLNSTDDDVFFKPVKDGYEGYIAKYDPSGYGKQDIYRVEIFSDEHPRKFLIRGIAKVSDLLKNFRDSVRITAMNIKNPDQMVVVYTNPATGEYQFQVPQGNYEVTYNSPSGEEIKKDLSLALNDPADSINMPQTVLPKTDFEAELSVETNKNISVTGGDSVNVPLKLEPNSILTIEQWAGDSLVYSGNVTVPDSSFNYKLLPQPGDNKIVFKVTDKYNNSTSSDILITREEKAEPVPLVRPEYKKVIAGKQVAALADLMKNRAGDKLKRVITGLDLKNRQFSKVDDLVDLIKEEASAAGISASEVDMTALKVASMDNILTQAAVNLLAFYAESGLKQILEAVDIDKLRLKTWKDLLDYVTDRSNAGITGENVNDLASMIIAGPDPAIALIREKILAYSSVTEDGQLIREAVEATEVKPILKAGEWLKSVYDESLSRGIDDLKMADMFATISVSPDTDIDDFTAKFAGIADAPLRSWLNSITLKKEKIRTPSGLFMYILDNRNNAGVTDDDLFGSIARLAAAGDVTPEAIREQMTHGKERKFWLLWIVAGAGIIWFLVFIVRKKKRTQKD